MAGYHTLLSRCHISAALALATVAFLAVPENAFADPDWCTTYCALVCGGDPTCASNCSVACEDGWSNGCAACSHYSGQQYTECMDGCNAQGGTCRNTGKDSTDCARRQCQLQGGDPTACVAPGRLGCDTGATCIACECDYRATYADCLCW
jgi:hypothetical protein